AKVASQWEAPQRLGGFKKVAVRSGGKADVSVDIEPHAFAIFDMKRKRWVIVEGDYEIRLATDAMHVIGKTKIRLKQQVL
ncbi:MAG TPA: fibronectin type III-like domain-contianing protein, partial [Steroidobacteraceae bacterium]|nr:fibronectin type III-like domain-contianing protein [Steroidobacteraceae bacterium]